MKISPIRAHEYEGYVWEREDGTKMTATQAQGLDYVLFKEIAGKERASVTSYSDPGYFLYSALAYFLKGRNELPPFEEIQTLDGKFTEAQESGFPLSARELVFPIDLPLATVNGNKIEGYMPFVGGYVHPHISYHALVDDGRFLFIEGTPGDKYSYGMGTLDFVEVFDLYPEEAVNVMKVLFANAFGNEELQKFHELIEGRL